MRQAAIREAGAARIETVGFRATIFAEKGSQTELRLSKALGVMIAVLRNGGQWVARAAAHKSIDGKPGDCLFLPPACLMDLDEIDVSVAKQWRLMIGHLAHPTSKARFVHCWLVCGDAVVSVSNLRTGYPAYAKTRADYYDLNRVVGRPVPVSPRALRATGRRLQGGSALAKWLAAKLDQDTPARSRFGSRY